MYMVKTDGWYLERILYLIMGLVALATAVLAWYHSPYWLFLTGFMGMSLIILSLTGFCIMANILYALGAKPVLNKE